jgi:GT2 family glycosyltransferase
MDREMKLSIIIVCYDDLAVIKECLRSIYVETKAIDFEVIISDNGSTDGSVEFICKKYPQVRIIKNRANLGFSKANNIGIRAAQGEYILILNPDTIIHNRALENLVKYADQHPEGGAFGCRVLNPDGSLDRDAAIPIPTVWRTLLGALGLRWLGHLSDLFISDIYIGWDGRTERTIGRQIGCCVMFPAELLKKLGGFDEQFFYHKEETDLCYRVFKSGYSVMFYPGAEITHLGGQTVSRFPSIPYRLESYRSSYRFFFKHYGVKSTIRLHKVILLQLRIRHIIFTFVSLFKSSKASKSRLENNRVMIEWNKQLDPIRLVENGEEPDVGYKPLSHTNKIFSEPIDSTTRNANVD